MVSTPKHWQLSSWRGPGAGLARAAPGCTGAQKPGPISAHSIQKRLEMHLEEQQFLPIHDAQAQLKQLLEAQWYL